MININDMGFTIPKNDIPVSTQFDNSHQNSMQEQIPHNVASAMYEMAQNAAVNGVSEISLAEINAEIEAVRKETIKDAKSNFTPQRIAELRKHIDLTEIPELTQEDFLEGRLKNLTASAVPRK